LREKGWMIYASIWLYRKSSGERPESVGYRCLEYNLQVAPNASSKLKLVL